MICVLGIPGSLRRGSYNRLLLEALAESVPPGMALSLYDGLGALPLFNEDLDRGIGGQPEPVTRLRDAVRAADALAIATPEYNQSIPGVLKNALDWLSRPGPDEVLVGKPVAVLGATTGRWGTRLSQAALRQVLYATEALVLPAPMVFVREAHQQFDEAGRLTDGRTHEALRTLLASLATWVERAPVRTHAAAS